MLDKDPRTICIAALDQVNESMLTVARLIAAAETSTDVADLCDRLNSIDNGRFVLTQMVGQHGQTDIA